MAAFHLTEQEGLCKTLGEGIRAIFEQDVDKTMVQANGAFIDARLQLLEQFKKDRMPSPRVLQSPSCSVRWKVARNSSREIPALPENTSDRAEYMLNGEKNRSLLPLSM